MRAFRNLAFVLFLVVASAPAVVTADGPEFCSVYGEEGCDCDYDFLLFFGECTGYENCAETFSNYCEDAWLQCIDHCWDVRASSSNPEGPYMPMDFDCIEDFECSMYCEC